MKKPEIAELLGLKLSTVQRWIDMGLPDKKDYSETEIILFLYQKWHQKANPGNEETKKLIELEDLRKKKFANDLAEGQFLDKAETEELLTGKLTILSDAILSVPAKISHKFKLEQFVEKALHTELH